jgi:hypothetical protein
MPQITLQPAEALGIAAAHANLSSDLDGYTWRPNRFFRFQACRPLDAGASLQGTEFSDAAIPPPPIDWRLWNGSDDIATFLNTQDPSGGWTDSGDDPTFGGHATRDARPDHTILGTWICDVATWMLPYVSGRAYRAQDARLYAPVWPGMDRVVLGTPVALSPGVTVESDMHGVIIEMTTIPPEMDHIAFDSVESWYHVGQIVFEADESILEGFHFWTFPKQVVCPTKMTIAWACHLRCALGIEGTVTPWRIVGLYGET